MQHDEARPDQAPQEASARGEASEGGQPATGVPAVDEVLRSVQGLEARPVGEHVEVFERAHERLRRALDAADTSHGG